jgi:hypothetical protein
LSINVFANGNAVACKAGNDKVIAAFPDVCLSPPSPPAGPIPVPYPDSSFSKDMKNGSKSVKVKRKEAMLKDKSFYKSSPLGDEAATKSFGSGVISHVITGKTYFVAWSMDVKFEGKNVDRHLDLTTSNHACPMANEQLTLPGMEASTTPPVDKDKLCPCCEEPLHPNQKDSAGNRLETIKEADFYAGSGPTPAPTGLSQQFIPGTAPQSPYEAAKALNCGNLPDPADEGCGTYFKPEKLKGAKKKKKRAGVMKNEWRRRRAEYVAANPQKNIGPNDDIAHRTARAGGGCMGDPTGKNLVPVKELSPDCQKIDAELGKQQAAAKRALL